MKKLLKRIWRAIPQSTLKTKIHCTLYNREGFTFAYRDSVFVTHGPKGIHLFTHEAPFNLIKYYRWFLKHYAPKPGDTVVDAGAYNGHVSILLSQLAGPSGLVVSFEPDPSNRALCYENMKLNNCSNIMLVDKGLWTENTVLEFNSNNSVASSVFYEASDAHKIQIGVTSLNLFFQHHNLIACHYIKMNIEGSEIMALKGASEILKKYKPALTITTDHIVEGKQTTEPVEQILKQNYYNVWTETEGSAKITYAG
jgi:FkbM family methyltransferase